MARSGSVPRRRPIAPSTALVVSLLLALVATSACPGVAASGRSGPPPVLSVNATATPLSGPVPLTVTLAAHASNGFPPYSYTWSFGDQSPNQTGPFTNHTYPAIAVYRVVVTASDTMGEVAEAALDVNATPAPLSIGLTANRSAIAAGETTYLEALVQGGLAPFGYVWSGLPAGCPAQPVQTLSCTPLYGGSYVVNVTVTDARHVSASATVALVVSGPGPPVVPRPGPTAPDYTGPIVAVTLIGIGLVVVAALIGRRARRRRERSGS